jgi:hypothetical protein
MLFASAIRADAKWLKIRLVAEVNFSVIATE